MLQATDTTARLRPPRISWGAPAAWIRPRWLPLATGLAAAIPVIVSTVRGLGEGWVPFGDQAIIATRAYDVFTSHTPLVGQYSASYHVTHHVTYSLGPLLYWLLAIPVRIGPPGSAALAIGALNAAAVIGAVVLARRRGGVAFMFATAVALAVMTRALAPELLHDPWNPSAGVVPFALLVFLCWSLACGEHRLLPLTVVVASFVVQCHLTFLAPSAGMLVVALVGLAVVRVRRRAAPPRSWPWWIAALVAAAICWSAPTIDELEHNPGNITVVAHTALAHQRTVGWSSGWHAVTRAIGIVPWWLRAPTDPFYPLADVRPAPTALAQGSSLAILALLMVVLVAGLVRRRAELASGAAIALVLCAALAAVTAKTPAEPSLMSTLGYSLWWGVPAGTFVWLFGGWSLAALAGRVPRLARIRLPRAAAGLGLLAALAAGSAVAAAQGPDQHRSMYRPISALVTSIERAIPHARSVLLDGSPGYGSVLRAGVRYQLRADGVRAFAPQAELRLSKWYDLDHHRFDYGVYVQDNNKFPSTRGSVVGRVTWIDGGEVHRLTVRVWRAAPPRARRA